MSKKDENVYERKDGGLGHGTTRAAEGTGKIHRDDLSRLSCQVSGLRISLGLFKAVEEICRMWYTF